jgi:hypothetical protein
MYGVLVAGMNLKELLMRKILIALSAVAAVAVATPADAQSARRDANWAAPVAGAAVGTTVGVGLYNGWITGSAAALPHATVAAAASTGAVAGIGTVALVHAATTPCQGFHAALGGFLTSPQGCANGQPVEQTIRMRRVR